MAPADNGAAQNLPLRACMLLFELFPVFYLVSGFTIVAGLMGIGLFAADRQARSAEKRATSQPSPAHLEVAA